MKDNEFDFKESKVTITTSDGSRTIPCVIHEKAKGLCVSHEKMGCFVVTHTHSGLKLTNPMERMWSAVLHMAQLQELAVIHGFSWDVPKDELFNGNKDLSLIVRGHAFEFKLDADDEFPHEGEHPSMTAWELLMGDDIEGVQGL